MNEIEQEEAKCGRESTNSDEIIQETAASTGREASRIRIGQFHDLALFLRLDSPPHHVYIFSSSLRHRSRRCEKERERERGGRAAGGVTCDLYLS